MRNETLQQVKEAIRRPYAWPGGYPVYTILADGEMLCAACARAEFRQIARSTRDNLRDGWRAAGAAIHWEGPDEYCMHCNKALQSAYGDPDEA